MVTNKGNTAMNKMQQAITDNLSHAKLGGGWRMTRNMDGSMMLQNENRGQTIVLPPESVAKLLDVASHRRED